MKAGTQNHLKVKRLKRLLGVPLYQAVGILETLWLLAIDCCDEGDVGKYSDEEIADYLEWGGSASELVRALADAGWIDPDQSGRYVIHDWLEHAPEFIRERVRKRRERKSKSERRLIDSSNQTTYAQSAADNTGRSRTDQDQPPLVPSIPNPTNPNQCSPSLVSDGEREGLIETVAKRGVHNARTAVANAVARGCSVEQIRAAARACDGKALLTAIEAMKPTGDRHKLEASKQSKAVEIIRRGRREKRSDPQIVEELRSQGLEWSDADAA
jgi:hypothetical protein